MKTKYLEDVDGVDETVDMVEGQRHLGIEEREEVIQTRMFKCGEVCHRLWRGRETAYSSVSSHARAHTRTRMHRCYCDDR